MKELMSIIYIIWHINALVSSESTFKASFNDSTNSERFNTDKWGRYVGEINGVINFTACHWEKLQFFAKEYNPVWSYCTEMLSSRSTDRKEDDIRCIQLYTTSDTETWGNKVILMGWLENIEVKTTMNHYRHRQWNHICWTYSSLTSVSRFYVNGNLEFEMTTQKYDTILNSPSHEIRSVFIIGQEPDKIDPDFGFEKGQVFSGELSELNLWNKILDHDMIKDYSKCEHQDRGNIVSWSNELFEFFYKDIKITKISKRNYLYPINLDDLCETETSLVMFPGWYNHEESKTICAIHGGNVVVPRSKIENEEVRKVLSQHEEYCMNSAFEPWEGIWINLEFYQSSWYEFDDNIPMKEANHTNWKHNDDNTINYIQNRCAYMERSGKWNVITEEKCTYIRLCTLCSISGTPVFSIKGDVNEYFDFTYYLHVDDSKQVDFYEGYKISKIVRNGSEWIQRHYSQDYIGAVSSETTLPLGRHTWTIPERKDNKSLLVLSTCILGSQFTCTSGRCVEKSSRCNHTVECGDGSDEEDCELVKIPRSYKKNLPPKTDYRKIIGNNHSDHSFSLFDVSMFVRILSIGSIDTTNMEIDLTIGISMWWKDDRLLYANIYKDEPNSVSKHKTQHLWLPLQHVVHENAIIGAVDEHGYKSVRVIRSLEPLKPLELQLTKDKHKRSIILRHIEDSLYMGSGNDLNVGQRIRKKYECTFDVTNFPFDRPFCHFNLSMKAVDKVFFNILKKGKGVEYTGATIVGQFKVEKVGCYTEENHTNESKFIFTIHLQRDVKQVLLTTFLPTFLLWLLGYFSLLIEITNFSDRLMCSVTVLVVFASLVGSIYEHLPKTSYVKFIDLWVVWYLVNIFLICIFHITLNIYSNKKDEKGNKESIIQTRGRRANAIQMRHESEKTEKVASILRAYLVALNRGAQILFPIATLLFNIFYFIRIVDV